MSNSNWYDGMSYEQIAAALQNGTAPGSNVPGAVILVPDGFMESYRAGCAPTSTRTDGVVTVTYEVPITRTDQRIESWALSAKGLCCPSCAARDLAIEHDTDTYGEAYLCLSCGESFTVHGKASNTHELAQLAAVRSALLPSQAPSDSPSPAPPSENCCDKKDAG